MSSTNTFEDDVLFDIAQEGDFLGLDHVDRQRNLWGRAENIFIK
jgi:hypothetical protein